MFEGALVNSWFWAFLAAVGWALWMAVVGTRVPGRSVVFGVLMLILAELPRVLLPMPFVPQVRFEGGFPWLPIVGVAILAAALYFATPVLRISPLTAPDRAEPLGTDGLYSIVRHPIMVCDALWPLGWSLVFASKLGVALSAVWVLLICVLTQIEEEALVRQYGDAYREFQARVPRLIPFIRRPRTGGRATRH